MLFKPFGEIAEVELVVDKATGRGKGYAVVTFMFPENAVAAYAALDATIFKVRDIALAPCSYPVLAGRLSRPHSGSHAAHIAGR
jgi:RNA recognition motif-containing protein